MKKIILFGLTISLINVAKSQIAITEFMSNSTPNDTYHEWIELYNYSTSSVNLKNWRLTDEDTDSTIISTSDLIMQPNTYLILAIDKDSMELNWFGGTPNSLVIDINNYFLGNSGDEIVIKDSTGTKIWSVAYADDELIGIATFLQYSHNFSTTITTWGSKAAPGIDRDSLDVSGTIGYQGDTTTDVNNRANAFGDLQGSPLAGGYTPISATSIEENDLKNSIIIYPNPSNEGVIYFSEVISGNVFSIEGEYVTSFKNVNSLNIETLHKGSYIIKTNDRSLRFVKF